MSHWELNPIADSVLLVLAIGGLLAALAIWGLSRLRLTKERRYGVGALRLLLIAMLALVMLQPTCTSIKRTRQAAVFIVLVDQSRSMTLPQANEGQSRYEAQSAALAQAKSSLGALAEEMEVQVLAYDAKTQSLPLAGGKIEFPKTPEGSQTDIGGAIDFALRQARGKRLAGILLLGDGAQTAFEPKVEIQAAAHELSRQSVPLYACAFGPEGEAAASRDVAIENLPDQFSVFVKNDLLIQGVMRVRGFANQQIPVELVIEDKNGKKETLGPQLVSAAAADSDSINDPDGDSQVEVEFHHTPQTSGQYKLTMRAVAQPGELIVKNNELTAFLTVLEGGLRVLYLEGELRPEAAFLRRSLAASPDIELDFQWLDHRRRETWPVDLTATIQGGKYDVFILGDLDSSALHAAGQQEQNLKLVQTAVADGKGLLALGGYHSFGPGGWRSTPLRHVLPIVMGEFERQDFDAPPVADFHWPGPVNIAPTEPHFLTLLGPEEDFRKAWRTLAPLDGANKFAEVKDVARVLAESESGAPLLVTGEFGRGRVAAFAGDSTWRWRLAGRDALHKRFWRQMILWLARRDDLIQNDVWVRLPQRRFNPGAGVKFTAGARSPGGDPLAGVSLKAVVEWPDGVKRDAPLSAGGQMGEGLADREGDFLGEIADLGQPGVYKIQVFASQGGKAIGSAQAQFEVFDQDVELANPAARHDQFAQLAAVTSDAGGRLITESEIDGVLKEVRTRPLGLEVETPQRRFLGKSPVDAWLVFLTMVLLLTVEWALRKRWALA